ncbi:hypothetical protein [Nonomuraea dietziae]|uniref:hypothetical protein n=1 Tax=Nonomuraea dietziae TaxID=65515 RepID=UPI00343663E0
MSPRLALLLAAWFNLAAAARPRMEATAGPVAATRWTTLIDVALHQGNFASVSGI